MTLYWWMHWFWITTLKFQVLLSFSGGPFVWSASLLLSPAIQNGHQNGPPSNEAPTKLVTSISPSSTSTDIGQDPFDGYITSPPYIKVMKPTTENQQGVGVQKESFPFKNTPGPHLETSTTQKLGTSSYPFTTDKDSMAHSLTVVESGRVDNKDIKTVGVIKVSKIAGAHNKHIAKMEVDGKVEKESLLEDIPLNDGPYDLAGASENRTNDHVETVTNTQKSFGITTSNDNQFVSTGKTEEEMKGNLTNYITSSEKPLFLVTQSTLDEDSSITRTLGQSVGDVANWTLSSTESILEDDYNTSLIPNVNSVFVTKADVVLPTSAQRNKSSPVPENAKSVATFENGHLEESTKVPSILVQSVIDESAIPKGTVGMDAAVITGIAFGAVVMAGLIGAISFVLYRRRYMNKPQTLNDKCSNPDSSGYIDDSTLRENSEEMYSLDNDSFLNSLEAMTIQNYWTDNVKHTKL